MRKKYILIAILTLGMLTSLFIVIKLNPPLEVGTLASSKDGSLIVIGVGNSGLQGIQIKEVLVNNEELPSIAKIQHSNPMQGFTIADEMLQENALNFKKLSDVTIQTKTSPTVMFNNMDNGTASENDEIYGITAKHTDKIHKIQFTYHYFGIPFKETISTDHLGTL